MPLTLTKVFDKNLQGPGFPLGGDFQLVVYDVALVDNYPGAAGEAVDFSADFIQVYNVITSMTQGAALSLIATFVPGVAAVDPTGFMHFFGGAAGAGAPFAELGAGAYGAVGAPRIVVIGRPATDQG